MRTLPHIFSYQAQSINMMSSYLIICFCILLLPAVASYSIRQAQENSLPDGIWTFRGYGYTIQVDNGTATLFEETDISCIVNPILLSAIYDTQVEDDVARLSVFRFVPYFVLDKTDSFQAACVDSPTPVIGDDNYERDALEVFDVLDQTFVEHFAHFDNRIGGIAEWVLQTMEARANLSSDSTDEELASTFESLLVPLDDYHTWVKDLNGDVSVYSQQFLWQFQDEFEKQTAIDDWETYKQNMIITPWRENAASYMQNDLTVEESGLAWGQTNESVGYMWMQTIPNDVFTFGADFETALTALNDTDALVIDIRVNSGGSDQTAILIASHFTSKPFLAFTKQATGGEKVEVNVEPSALVYSKPIVMIISRSSYSAAETLPLAMMQLPQTTLLGENTGGSYSELPKTLPNGWAFSLFSEIYLSPDGIDYDQVGIPPDIATRTELLPLSERQRGVDSWLELALETAQDSNETMTSDAPKAHKWGLLWFASIVSAIF